MTWQLTEHEFIEVTAQLEHLTSRPGDPINFESLNIAEAHVCSMRGLDDDKQNVVLFLHTGRHHHAYTFSAAVAARLSYAMLNAASDWLSSDPGNLRITARQLNDLADRIDGSG
jgi:hypothetical protein